MYGCALHRREIRREMTTKEDAAAAVEEPVTASGPLAPGSRVIDRETMLRLGLPASMVERLLERSGVTGR